MASSSKKLEDSKIESRKEIVIPITLRGLAKGYSKIFHKAPLNLYQTITRKLDKWHQPMMTGMASILSMPLGIMIRNGSRAANRASKDDWNAASLTGAVGAGAAWWIAGKAAFAGITSYLGVAGTAGSIASGVAAAVVTAPVLAPAFTAGILLGSTAIGAAAFTLSTIPAVVNLPVAAKRTMDRIKGYNYDQKEIEEELTKDSLETKYQVSQYRKAQSIISYLDDENKKKIFVDLKKQFETAALDQGDKPENNNVAAKTKKQSPQVKKPDIS